MLDLYGHGHRKMKLMERFQMHIKWESNWAIHFLIFLNSYLVQMLELDLFLLFLFGIM